MTVKELINRLQKEEPDTEIYLEGHIDYEKNPSWLQCNKFRK